MSETSVTSGDERMTAEQVEAFMQKLHSYFKGNWPTMNEFSHLDAEEEDLQDWEREIGWTFIEEEEATTAEAVSEQGVRFTESDYAAWLQRPQEEWPEERIDRIAQSDGSGDHYPKQQRYQDNQGDDWIDECARTMTPEQFRGAMLFTIGKYLRRMGKKDAIESEVRKVADYAQRWQQYEEAINEHGA